jgi:hypothetical protein
MKEWNRAGERKMRKIGKYLLFALKVSFIVQCGLMLHSFFFKRGMIDHVVDFTSLGVSAWVTFTAMLFLSGHVAPGSCWGWVDWHRQKRARHNHRFGIRHIAITELWIAYIVISCGLLRVFVFSPLELPRRIVGVVLFAIFTALILIAVILISEPRSFWGRMQRFVLKEGSPHRTQRR